MGTKSCVHSCNPSCQMVIDRQPCHTLLARYWDSWTRNVDSHQQEVAVKALASMSWKHQLPSSLEPAPPMLEPLQQKRPRYYKCGYCQRVAVSSSQGQDGRIRIRCPCGGKHRDGVSRMHALWTESSPAQKATPENDQRSLKRPRPWSPKTPAKPAKTMRRTLKVSFDSLSRSLSLAGSLGHGVAGSVRLAQPVTVDLWHSRD